jgi:hypothetical protein
MVSISQERAAKAALLLEAERRRGKLDYLFFLENVLGIRCMYTEEPGVRRYLDRFGALLSDWLAHRHDKLPDGTLVQKVPRKILITVPRKTFKTSGCTEAGIPFALVNDPNLVCGVMCASYEDLAIPIARNVRDHLEGESSTSQVKILYGEFKKADAWSADKFTIAQRDRTIRDPSLSVYGVRKGVVGHHFDLFGIDDPVTNEAMQNNSDWLDRTWRSWVDLKAALNPNSLVFLVMTRYHDADLAGRIVINEIEPAVRRAHDGQLPDDWAPDSPDAIRKYGHLAGWEVIYEQAVIGLDTESPVFNFPGIWGPDRITDVRAGRTIDGDEESEEYSELFFWCQLQNTPQKREDNPIQQHHLDIARGTPEPWTIEQCPKVGFVDIHCDFAFKDAESYLKQKGDFSVIHVTVPEGGFVWRINGWRGKVTQDMFGEQLIRIAHWCRNDPRIRARIRFITYDMLPGAGSGDESTKKWIQNLFYQHADLNMPTCLPIKTSRGAGVRKADRILSTAWAWQEGWVRLCGDVPGVDQLLYQMSRVGYTPHDDDADAFANAFHSEVYKAAPRVGDELEDAWNWTPAILPAHNAEWEDSDFEPNTNVWTAGGW